MSALKKFYGEVVLCQKCGLAKSRINVVPGEGAENAGIMFVGEAPGWHEDQQGRPFVGPAGQFLEELLASINLKRGEVYIANVIKCRPPGNRDPLPIEIQKCRPWLQYQIELIHPRMIVALGRYSMVMFFPGKSVSKIHGTAQKRDNIVYYAMYHPAAALHQGSLRKIIKEDMLKIPLFLDEAKNVDETKLEAEQLKMF
ncbi:uracil-DNA glycosylase [Chloroflexota bacterium]